MQDKKRIGNICDAHNNMLTLMTLRSHLASYENQAHWVGENFVELSERGVIASPKSGSGVKRG